MPLTSAFHRDYAFSAGGVPPVGFDSPVQRRTSRHSCGFFIVRHFMATLYGRAVWEGLALPVPLPGLSTHTVPPTRLTDGKRKS